MKSYQVFANSIVWLTLKMPWVSLTQLTILGLYDWLCSRFRMKTYNGGKGIFRTCLRGRPRRLLAAGEVFTKI
jgi:hypothetical protein